MRRRFTLNQQRIKTIVGAVLFTLAGTTVAQQNTTFSYEYDAMGNRTKITDPLGHVTTQSYDSLGRLMQQTQPAPTAGGSSPTISYSYDGLAQLSTVTDPRNLVTSYSIDGLGNQTALTSPDTGSTTKTYDVAGNLKASTDARGKTTNYSYDALNRLTRIDYASGAATQFEYDGGATGAPNAIGHLTRMIDGSGQTTYAYDGFGHLLTKVQTIVSGTTATSRTTSYTYGSSGNTVGMLASMTYPSGNRINFSYDAAGRVNSLSLNPTNASGGTNSGSNIALLTGIGYQAFGAVNAWTWGNSNALSSSTYARGIDLDGRITSYPLGDLLNNGTNRSVSYDAAGRIVSSSHIGSGTGNNAPANYNQGYGYDNLDRLTSVTGSSGANNQSFQYDANGNRTQATFGGSTYANTIAATRNRLNATSGPAPAKSNSYDAAGNLLSDGSISYTYSDRGRMVSATNAGNTVTYSHNGLEQRVQKQGPAAIVATGSNSYVYDEADHLIGEYDANGQVIEETVYLGDLPVAVLKQAGIGANQTTATNVYYVYADHVDTPRVITQATDNQMVWRWDNADPFGMLPPDENPSGLGVFTYNQRFPGQLYDKETNNFYNINRDYDPQLGRYLESDPIGLGGGINTYTYGLNQPTRYTDPEGLNVAAAARPAIKCLLNPVCRAAAAAAATAATAAVAKICSDGIDKFLRWWYSQDNAEGANSGNGKSGAKPPKDTQPISNPPQAPVIPPDWESKPGRNGGEVYYPPGTNPADGEHIRVMPPGSSPVPGYEDGYWRWVNGNKQPMDPSTGKPGRGQGDTHVPLPPDSLPPPRR
ncbi:RHS repeat-associated core domain-containing protein [Paraherbaspirillum soli]|uniref:RHS repeat-associated core domain-containing protein n=1 Tax=Paraherbaspirillum soli TaxID=631222 RepID=A0ABW0M409_9BURK